MANKKTNVSKPEAKEKARQKHNVIREFLNQEPIRTELIDSLISCKGHGNELKILKALLCSENPISNTDLHQNSGLPKATISLAAKELDKYLREQFSNVFIPLTFKEIAVCLELKESRGGSSPGYYFTCFDNQLKEYMEVNQICDLIESLWDDYARSVLKATLKDDAQVKLSEKLKGRNDYQCLDLEVGTIKDKKKQYQGDVFRRYNHNREWIVFDINKIYNLKGVYVLVADAGSGKTTFLRKLQIELLEYTDHIPIFLEASKIQECVRFFSGAT